MSHKKKKIFKEIIVSIIVKFTMLVGGLDHENYQNVQAIHQKQDILQQSLLYLVMY